MKVDAQGEQLMVVQLRLKQPKTARTIPHQLVELQETGWICLSKLWKAGCMQGKGVSWKEGQPSPGKMAMTDFNMLLEALIGNEKPKITTRAFRPALPTILAREGVTEHWGVGLVRVTYTTYAMAAL